MGRPSEDGGKITIASSLSEKSLQLEFEPIQDRIGWWTGKEKWAGTGHGLGQV